MWFVVDNNVTFFGYSMKLYLYTITLFHYLLNFVNKFLLKIDCFVLESVLFMEMIFQGVLGRNDTIKIEQNNKLLCRKKLKMCFENL